MWTKHNKKLKQRNDALIAVRLSKDLDIRTMRVDVLRQTTSRAGDKVSINVALLQLIYQCGTKKVSYDLPKSNSPKQLIKIRHTTIPPFLAKKLKDTLFSSVIVLQLRLKLEDHFTKVLFFAGEPGRDLTLGSVPRNHRSLITLSHPPSKTRSRPYANPREQ